jgi:nuclear pore complex protein Nup188
MTGSGSQRDGNDIDPDAEASAESVYELFNNLSFVTFEYTEDPRMMSIFERERTDTGHVYLINRVPVQLPGGSVIPKGTRGRVISRPRVIPEVVKWVTPISGFGLLLETMKLAVGLVGEADSAAVGNAEEDVFGTTQSGIELFSLRDIGITQAMVQDGILLSDGLAYLEALLRASSDTSDLAAAIAVLGQTPEQASGLVPTLLAVIKQRPSRIATMDDSRIQTLARATRILARLLRCIPGPICDFLRRPAFFHDQAAYPSIAKAGIHLEIRRGTYCWTTSILQLVHALAVEVLSKQLVTAPDLLHVQVNTLRSALVFTHTIIWSEFDTWRYARIGDKATIGELLCRIYRMVLSDPLVFASLQKPSPMRPISAFIAETFITSPAPFSIGPLVNALRTPYKLVPALHRRNRRADSAKVEKHLDQALQLAETLLRQSQLLPAPRPAALEGSFTRTDLLSENETRTLVDTIFGYAVSTDIFDRTISISSLRLLRTLARGLAQLGSAASPMLVCLQDATATAADLMAILANPERDMDLTYEVWALLNAAATTQPGLLRLCVTGEGEGTALIDANASDRTAMAIALGIIERYGKSTDGDALWETRPRLLSLATSFLKSVWENLPDLILADRVKTNSDLWTSIEQLVLQNQISPNILDLNHWERDTTDDTIAYCYRRVARANAVDLMQLSLKSSQATRGERDVGLTRTSTLLADKERVAGAVAEAGQNACRPEVHQRLHDLFTALYPECAVEDLRSGKDEQDRVYGDQYLFGKRKPG